MGLKAVRPSSGPDLLTSSRDYFVEVVDEAFSKRQLKVPVVSQKYLVDLLEHYLFTQNLFDPPSTAESGRRRDPMLAEMLLQAGQSPDSERQDILKKLADRSLYISGFFGDSLERSLVDVDYYAEIGGTAYGWLADSVNEAEVASVYRTYSRRFLDFAEVLTYISQRSMVQNDQSLLRLYDRYLKTGSELAREQLAEHGVVALSPDQLKASKQN